MPPDKIKLLNEIRSRPKNVRANELRKLMLLFDFTYREISDGVVYKHKKLYQTVTVAEHRGKGQEKKIKPCYVKNCIKAIDTILLIEEGGEGDGC